MTVIAWDGRTLAADRMAECDGTTLSVRKVYRASTGQAVAVAGTAAHIIPLLRWVEAGARPEDWPEFQRSDQSSTLVVATPGRVLTYEQEPHPIEFLSRAQAWGCGRAAALGALLAGASAVRAVMITGRVDSACGRGVDAVPVG